MRHRSLLPLLAALAISAPVAADYDRAPPPPSQQQAPTSGSGSPNADPAVSGRAQAERYYSDAYNDMVKAGKEADKGKKDSSLKRYRRARERCQQAVQLDSTYHEAWNLVGFTSRKLGDYPASFAAYRVALRLKPDFALAHEYYGEGLLETGDLAGAREQLTALSKCGTPELIAELEASISKYIAAHPEPATATPAN